MSAFGGKADMGPDLLGFTYSVISTEFRMAVAVDLIYSVSN